MNYELGKKLKDAGFPSENFCGNENHGMCSPDYPCNPSLSELIEACGDESILILTIGKAMTSVVHGVKGLVCNGKTPKEAVANLWLALHTK